MSLQFIIGNSGAGKSCTAYQNIIEEARVHSQGRYYVLVPEQFTMQTQKTIVDMHPDGGILNIDILSFERLAYRVFEEVGGDTRRILQETGKNMVLQKLVQSHQEELVYLGNRMKKPGYLDQVKSLISEFMQYEINEDDLTQMKKEAGEQGLLGLKLADVSVLYRAFREYLSEHYMTSEEVLEVLAQKVGDSEDLKGSVVLLDGYTGFTPIQLQVIRALLKVCSRVIVTVTMDVSEPVSGKKNSHQLFMMSRQMIHALSELTNDIVDPVYVGHGANSRFANAPAIAFLEQNLFRYNRKIYEAEQQEIQLFSAANPQREMEEAARRIHRLVRENGYRYGQIAVITGNLDVYGDMAKQVFKNTGIPYFIDEKHSILMNPFVEYIRSALEMIVQNFSYESVFRYLRCGMSGLKREEIDELENYVLALGIRGQKKWKETWVRSYRGMQPERVPELNRVREAFGEEVSALTEGFSHKKGTIQEYCECLYDFVVQSEIQKKLKIQEEKFRADGNKAMEKEYAQIYGIVMDLLDKMVEILGEETVTAQEFCQILENGMTQAKVALIPPSIDQVLVGDMERTRLKDVRALFFVGVNDGCIPKNTDSGGLLTEMDREFLKDQGMCLAPDAKEQMIIQQFYLYLNLSKPGELLCLSYSLANANGESSGPAYLIRTIQRLFPQLHVQRAENPEQELDLMEMPEPSLNYFLNGLVSEPEKQKEDLFRELYSWYLREPHFEKMVKRLVEASFTRKPAEHIGESVAKVLYGEVSAHSATRMEKFSACAFAHFLQYGLKISERAEYELRSNDMGNIVHQALEDFSKEVKNKGLDWADLDDETRNSIADECLDKIAADYGNTILKSSAANEYMIERTRRLLRRTVWALQEQLKNGKFRPEGFEVSIGGGRVDRLDVMEQDGKIYVKIIDYKTGSTHFDLVNIYHGLQLQLVVYMDAAVEAEKKKHPDSEVKPAGIFYYNVQDPMITSEVEKDLETIAPDIRKNLKMNGLASDNTEALLALDKTLESLPAGMNKDGTLRADSSVASEEQFEVLRTYVKKKIEMIRTAITSGEASISPYDINGKNPCEYCAYMGVCGFDKKIPGYDFRRLKKLPSKEIWQAMHKEVE